MTRYFLACSTLISLFASALMAASPPLPPAAPQPPASAPAQKAPEGRLNWWTDLDAAKKEAAASGRIIMIFFYADWGEPCALMESGTFGRPNMAQFIERTFIPVKVDDSKEAGPVSRHYEIRLYPTVLFLGPDGQPLHMVLGPRTAQQFYSICVQVHALPQLYDAQRKAPDDFDANYGIGSALATIDQLSKAEPFLKKCLELDPKDAKGKRSRICLVLAIVPLEAGDSAQALKNLDQYMTEFGRSDQAPMALYITGTVLFGEKRFEEARKVFQRIRKEYPKSPKAYEADKAIEAIDARLKAIQQQPNMPAVPAPPEPPVQAGPQPPPQTPKPKG